MNIIAKYNNSINNMLLSLPYVNTIDPKKIYSADFIAYELSNNEYRVAIDRDSLTDGKILSLKEVYNICKSEDICYILKNGLLK